MPSISRAIVTVVEDWRTLLRMVVFAALTALLAVGSVVMAPTAAHAVGATFSAPAAARASWLQVAPDRVLGVSLDDDPADTYAVWSRSVNATGFGAQTALPRRASWLGVSAGRTVIEGAEGVSVYERGALKATLPANGHSRSLSGPYLASWTGAVSVSSVKSGAKVASFVADDYALFGSLLVTFVTSATAGGPTTAVVNDLTQAMAPRTVTLPNTGPCYQFEVWNDFVAMECQDSVHVHNLRTGARVASRSIGPVHGFDLTGIGDGYVLLTEWDFSVPSADGYTASEVWTLSTDTLTPLAACGDSNAYSDGIGHIVCVSGTDLKRSDYSSISASPPRLLGAVADASIDFSKAGSVWKVDLDTTKPLAAGTLSILDASGHVVRTLSTPATSDGSLRDTSWDGLDSSGKAAPAGNYTYRLDAKASDGTGTVVSVDGTGAATGRLTVTAPGLPGSYVALAPSRLLDTRATGGTLKSGETRSLQVSGKGGVPTTGVAAVVLNVTVTETTSGGYLTASPTGTTRPTVSNLNWGAGTTIPNAVTVKVGTGGKIDLYQSGPGTAQVIVDVAGYYRAGTVTNPGGFTALAPARILDTRTTGGAIASGQTRDLQVTNAGGVPSGNVSAVVLNITATQTTSGGFLTVFPTGTTRPTASNLNWGAGATIPNLVTVKVGTSGKASLYQSGPGSAQIIADVAGYFLGGTPTQPGTFVALTPARVLDTRTSGKAAPGADVTLSILGKGGVPATGVSAVVINTTVTETTAPGYLTVYPGTTALPTASNLNWTAGATIPNLVIVRVGTNGTIKFRNGSGGTTQIIADTAGYYLT